LLGKGVEVGKGVGCDTGTMEGLRVSTTTVMDVVSTVAFAMAAETEDVKVSFLSVDSTC
jgi:hypothetical protein